MSTPHVPHYARRTVLLFSCVCLFITGTRTSLYAQQPAPSPTPTLTPAASETTRGIDLYRRGDNEGALATLRTATKAHKDDAEAWHYLGLALLKKQKPKDAQKAFERAITLRPEYPAALTELAYTYILQGRHDLASQFAARAVKLEPRNAQAHYFLGIINYRFNSFARALEETEAALKYAPTYALAVYLQGQVLLTMAGRALSTASDETPDVRTVLIAKADERLAAAAASIEKYAQLDPHSDDAALLREQLKTLRIYAEQATKPPSERAVLSSKEVTSRAVITHNPEPVFTEQARQHSTTGEVILRVVLGADGTVQNILPIKTLPDGLTEQAIKAAHRVRFIPATKDGRPVSQYSTIVYNFNIY
jgi:TonB family protein